MASTRGCMGNFAYVKSKIPTGGISTYKYLRTSKLGTTTVWVSHQRCLLSVRDRPRRPTARRERCRIGGGSFGVFPGLWTMACDWQLALVVEIKRLIWENLHPQERGGLLIANVMSIKGNMIQAHVGWGRGWGVVRGGGGVNGTCIGLVRAS